MKIPSEIREIGETRRLQILSAELAAIVRNHVQNKAGVDIGPLAFRGRWDPDEHLVLVGTQELDEEDTRRDVLAKVFTNDFDATMGDLALAVLGDILGVKAGPNQPGPYLVDVGDDIYKDGPWLFFVVETETPPPWDPHRVPIPMTDRECPECGTTADTLRNQVYGSTILCMSCGYKGRAKHPPAKPLADVLRRLFDSGTTEGATVADMLETIASNDDPDMQTPEHLVACLEELIDWARTARSDLQPDS